MISKPNTIDFMIALDILYPYRDRLINISKAYENEEFEPFQEIDYTDPYAVATYYEGSTAYLTYNIKELGEELSIKMQLLNFKDYSDKIIAEIELKHGDDVTHDFDGSWELREVYYYLIHIFKGNDHVVIENNIINGDLLRIMDCFFIRI